MTTTSPIAGNQYFSVVSTQAAQIPKVTAGAVLSDFLRSNTSSVGGLMVTGGASSLNGKKLYSVSGYAPSGIAASNSYFLNKLRGQANQATPSSTNSTVLVVPAGATIVGIVLEDATLAGPTVATGTQALTGIAPTGTVNLTAATAAAVINGGAMAGMPVATAALAAAAVPIVPSTAVAVAAAPTVTGVTITLSSTAVTATSGLAVIVYYLL